MRSCRTPAITLAVLDAAGSSGGAELEVEIRGGGAVIKEDAELPVRTAAAMRDVMEGTRR